jgi:hypothetical protein
MLLTGENIYQVFVAILFLFYALTTFYSRDRVPRARRWLKIGLTGVATLGSIFYLLLGLDLIDIPILTGVRRICIRGILTVWLTLLICDELRISRL